MNREPRILVVFPFEGKTTAGGPEGFITQLLKGFSHPELAVTPVPNFTPPLLVRRLRQALALLPGHAPHWGMSASEYASREALFHAAGMHRVRCLWFMDHGVYRLFEPFIAPDQTVIYQPHCPELPWLEIPPSAPDAVHQRREVETLVRRLLQRASVLVLPNEGVRSIYTAVLPAHLTVHYLQSGAARPDRVTPIPLDPQFTHMLYIGRRLSIKGFDLVHEAFQRAQVRRPDLRLVLCGPGERCLTPGVIDIGFTSRIHDWIASVDYVVNANRQSYLDLSVMETLAIGTPLLMTCSHGHALFRQWESPGLRPLDDATVAACESAFTGCSTSAARDPQVREANRHLYDREFSIARYHERLGGLIKTILASTTRAHL